MSKIPRWRGSVTVTPNRHVADETYINKKQKAVKMYRFTAFRLAGCYGVDVGVGLAVVVGVGLPSTGVEIGLLTVAVEVVLVGLLRGNVMVGVASGIGVMVGTAVPEAGGGQAWRLIVNCTQSLP